MIYEFYTQSREVGSSAPEMAIMPGACYVGTDAAILGFDPEPATGKGI